MTHDTTPPKRIWTATTDGKCHVGFDSPSLNYTHEYILASEVDALVAAALREAAKIAVRHWEGEEEDSLVMCEAILTLIPQPDAAAPDLARALLDARAELARVKTDAAAAQALMVERAEDEVSGEVAAHGEAHLAPFVRKRIRALADPTGVKLLAELRAERDALAADGAGVFWAEKARAFAMQMASVDARAKDAESERDRLAAANAALEAKVAGLRDFVDDFAKAKIDALRYSPPCGSSPEDDPDPVVDAETVWAWQADAKAALATQEAGNAQSTPPISPEEAQFNAVRYHERFGPLDEKGNPVDPRRRG